MKRYPAGAGCDDDPRRGWDRRRGDMAGWPVVVSFSCRRPQSFFADARRPSQAFTDRQSADLTSSTTIHATGARAGNLAVRERRRTRLERCPAAAAEPDGEGGKREAVGAEPFDRLSTSTKAAVGGAV